MVPVKMTSRRVTLMKYKTILVYLNDERRAGDLLDVATNIADRQSAHLIGLYVVPSGIYGSPTHMGARLIESGRQSFRSEGQRIGDAFEKATRGRSLVAEWRVVEPPHDHPGPAEIVLDNARVSDLVIAGQADDSWENSLLLDFPERIVLESGRPTLVVPHAGRFPKCGSRVLVAWNGKREAARAAFDALPLLETAEAVRILAVDWSEEDAGLSRGPLTEIGAALARHAVSCETAQSVAPDTEVADDLLNRAADFSADLIVMGCYGHSRLRELVSGGASRSILQNMTMPVLMAH